MYFLFAPICTFVVAFVDAALHLSPSGGGFLSRIFSLLTLLLRLQSACAGCTIPIDRVGGSCCRSPRHSLAFR